jgi:hypothetical protein
VCSDRALPGVPANAKNILGLKYFNFYLGHFPKSMLKFIQNGQITSKITKNWGFRQILKVENFRNQSHSIPRKNLQ